MPPRRSRDSVLAPASLARVLLDLSFTELVAVRIARSLFAFLLGVWMLLWAAAVVAGFQVSVAMGVGVLAGATVAATVGVMVSRLWVELIILVSRIADQVAEATEQAAVIAVNTRVRAARERSEAEK